MFSYSAFPSLGDVHPMENIMVASGRSTHGPSANPSIYLGRQQGHGFDPVAPGSNHLASSWRPVASKNRRNSNRNNASHRRHSVKPKPPKTMNYHHAPSKNQKLYHKARGFTSSKPKGRRDKKIHAKRVVNTTIENVPVDTLDTKTFETKLCHLIGTKVLPAVQDIIDEGPAKSKRANGATKPAKKVSKDQKIRFNKALRHAINDTMEMFKHHGIYHDSITKAQGPNTHHNHVDDVSNHHMVTRQLH